MPIEIWYEVDRFYYIFAMLFAPILDVLLVLIIVFALIVSIFGVSRLIDRYLN